ncbi:hypothetical protein HDV00_006559 [Rhizophlyctis rosea]|nr:hypothetical protein HDV00_006559 [Rhizophlyctis rosea]
MPTNQPNPPPTSPPPTQPPIPPHTIPKLLYFTLFLAFCSSPTLLTVMYRQNGLSTSQIGILASLSPWISMIAAPAWTWVADKKGKPWTVLVTTVIATAGVQWGLVLGAETFGFAGVLCMVMVGAVIGAPTGAVLDGMVYGRQRLWGAISCGLSTFLAGAAVNEYGSYYAAFILHTAFTGLFLVVLALCWQPLKALTVSSGLSTPQPDDASKPLKSNRMTDSETTLDGTCSSRWQTFLHTYSWALTRPVLAFFLSMAIMGASFAVVGSFLFIYMIEDLGATALLRGLSGPFDVALELPFFFYGNEVGVGNVTWRSCGTCYTFRMDEVTILRSVL